MSRYSKKHYEDIAGIIRLSRLPIPEGTVINGPLLTLALITLFEQDNPNFDRERFLEATR